MKKTSIRLLLLFALLTPGAFAATSPSQPIRSAPELSLQDTARNKKLPLRVTWPESPGQFPVIIWSHGAYGSKDAYKPLVEYWAQHGYVAIQPTHEDSVALGQKLGDKKVFQLWQTRPADVSLILDSLDALEKLEPALKGKLDAARIGVGGHSYGANTAQLVGGAKAYVMGREKSFEDKRVKAVMLLSGQGPGEMLTEKSWTNFTRPLFVMTGSKDGPTRTGQPAEWRKKPYELSPPGDKYLVWVEGLDHGYGGIAGVRFNPKNKDNPDHVRWTQIVTLAFWDAYLKENQTARDFLRSDKLTAQTKGALTVKWK